ncbi:DUF5316 family protein [Bacillus sp. JJ664]
MKILNLFIFIGIIGFLLSGITLGVFTSGEQQRANFYTQMKEDRKSNFKFSLWSGLVGMISFFIAGVIYYIQ